MEIWILIIVIGKQYETTHPIPSIRPSSNTLYLCTDDYRGCMKKYTIKEITTAWTRFTAPRYLVDNNRIDIDDLTKFGRVIEYSSSVQKLEIDYSQWIPYLLSEIWKSK